MNFDTVNIESICTNICSGGTPKRSEDKYYENGKIPWLNTKEINFNRIYTTENKITQLGLDNSSAKLIPKNSINIAMYGATAGKISINKIDLTTNQACCNLTINPKLADYNYIFYILSSKYKQLLNLASGAAQQNINTQVIKEFEINIPSIINQEKITKILLDIDKKIEINNRINNNKFELWT